MQCFEQAGEILYNHQSMRRLGCKEVAESILQDIKEEAGRLRRKPGLAVILVSHDAASETYVRKKEEAALELGFEHRQHTFEEDASEDDILALIDKLNADDSIDGILVQLPLPRHIDEKRVIERIAPDKDVDGFSPVNVGRLLIGEDAFVPCTPKGIMHVLSYYGIETAGKDVTVIGRSNIVGKPMAALLMQKGADATVTVCNTKTRDLRAHTLSSDIIIVATGHPGTIDSSYVRDGSVVIDVGVNRIPDSTKKKGFRLVGDADYDSFAERDVSITPVPGGIGLMTVAMLMENTLESAKRRQGL